MRSRSVIAAAALFSALLAGDALAHSGSFAAPAESGFDAVVEFSKFGVKHIVLGYDHILFLLGLALLCTGLRDVLGLAALFAVSYSLTLIGGTLAGIAVPGDLIDAIIAASVGFVGAQVAFGSPGRRLGRDPRPAAFVFGLAHGLGLSSLVQELRLPGDDLLPSVIGFNLGVEAGQLAVLGLFLAVLMAVRAFPFPAYQRIPAGCALISASAVFVSFLVLGISL